MAGRFSEPGSVAYRLAMSSVTTVAPMASIRFLNSARAASASGDSENRVTPPLPVSPNVAKVLILSSILSRLHEITLNSPSLCGRGGSGDAGPLPGVAAAGLRWMRLV